MFQPGEGDSVGDGKRSGGPQEKRGTEDKRPRTRVLTGPHQATELGRKYKTTQNYLSLLTAKRGLKFTLAPG